MEDRYEKFYKTDWEQAYGFWHKVITRGEDQVRIITDILSKINKNKIIILDVGCGKGDETKKALFHIKNKRFEITANDTSREALDQYSKINSKNVQELIQYRLENLPKKTSKKFDLILFSHCLYSVNLKGLFREYLKLLTNDGVILIFLDSKDSAVKRIQEKFWTKIHRVNFDENTAEVILNELAKEKIKYETIEFSSYMYLEKLKEIQDNGIVSLLIPFTFRTHEIKQGVIEQIASYIKKLEKDGKLDNKTFAIIIRK